MKIFWLVLAVSVLFLAGCGKAENGTPTSSQVVVIPTMVTRELPVTFTPRGTPVPVSPTPRPTITLPPATGTPTNFGDTAVELRYRIPALGLDRRLQGTIGSQIIFADEATGRLLQRNNQGMILLELQQVLPTLQLEPLPENCAGCVYLAYELPITGVSGEGWLQDPVLLASVENLLAVVLGPHFPPDTIVGLRRSASPYAPAQSFALTASGQVWSWLATEGEIDEPGAETAVSDLRAALNNLDPDTLAASYSTTCPGVPLETLYLTQEEQTTTIAIACPEYTLPAPLLPLYLILDDAMAIKLAASAPAGPPRPPAGFPLAALLDYKRADNTRLTLYLDGTTVAAAGGTAVFTTTLSAAEIISLTTPIIESGLVRPGLATFFNPAESGEFALLLVRGPQGVLDARWVGSETAVAALDDLLDRLLGSGTLPISAAETPTTTPTAMPTATPTGAPSP